MGAMPPFKDLIMMGHIIFKKPSIQKAIRRTLDTFNRESTLNKSVDVAENKKRKRKKDAGIDKATVQD